MGAAQYDNHQSITEFIHSADQALYHAKSEGRNCIYSASGQGGSVFTRYGE